MKLRDPYKFEIGDKRKDGFNERAHESTHSGHPYNLIPVPFFYTGTLATLAQNACPIATVWKHQKLRRILATVTTAPVGHSIDLTFYQNAQSFTTLSIAAGETTADSGLMAQRFVTLDQLTMSIDAVGSSTAGVNLQVFCWFGRA